MRYVIVDPIAFYQALSEGKREAVKELTQTTLAGGAPAEVVLEVLIAAQAMHGGLGVLKPVLLRSTREKTTTVVLGP